MRLVRRSSLLRLVVLTALAACLSAGLASAQALGGQSRPGAARGISATLSQWNYTPPDPCSGWEWAELMLANLASLL
jgi:hypothetical protein